MPTFNFKPLWKKYPRYIEGESDADTGLREEALDEEFENPGSKTSDNNRSTE